MAQQSVEPLGNTPPYAVSEPRIHSFSMTDEEGDLPQFQAYLHDLSPEALWDVHSHLDADRYPRRSESVGREIARRRLFYVTPYTVIETRLRHLFLWCALLAALAAALRAIGSLPIDLEPWQKLSFFYDLAVGGPKAALMVLPLERLVATLGEITALFGVALAVFRCLTHRLRGDVLTTGLAATALAALLLFWAYR